MPELEKFVRPEQIYDALLDDDCLKELPSIFAEAYGGRSCTLHWRHVDDGAEILSHCGYFSDEHMRVYAEHFAPHDVWTLRASERSRINRVWNCEEVVPSSQYEKSVFYNDWIRGMGDDTYYCMGTVMETRWGNGIIGIHRGKSQSSFDEEGIRALKGDVGHLRRMLAIRGRIAGAKRKTEELAGLLDTVGDAVIAVTSSGRILHANQAAEEILMRADGLAVRNGSIVGCSVAADCQLKKAIARADDPAQPEAQAIPISRSSGGRYELSLVATALSGGGRQVLITAHDPDCTDPTLEHRLRSLYGLTPVEARLAVRLSEGVTIAQIATERGVVLSTAQTQMKAVLAKLNCRRQAEVVRLVAGLPRLHPNARVA